MRAVSRLIGLAVLVAICGSAAVSLAADSGDAIFPIDLKDQNRIEVIYENIDREINVTSGPDGTGTFDADTLYIRFHTPVGTAASFDIDLGGLNPKGGDLDWYAGAGIRYLAFDTEALRVAIFAQGHYSPVQADEHGLKTKYDYFEGEGGVLFNGKIEFQEQLTFMPYIGPVLSMVSLDGDVSDDTGKADFDAEEESMFGLAAGVTLKMEENHSVRVETRYFDSWNFSVAAGVAF